MPVYTALSAHDLPEARTRVSWLVGRDTETLSEEGVTKAAVETIAENTADGAIAPLFWFAIGGVQGNRHHGQHDRLQKRPLS